CRPTSPRASGPCRASGESARRSAAGPSAAPTRPWLRRTPSSERKPSRATWSAAGSGPVPGSPCPAPTRCTAWCQRACSGPSPSRLLVCSPGGWIRPSWHRRGWHADRTMTTPKVPAADATLRLLTFLASRRSPVPAARIAAELGLPRSRTYDLLSTLVEHGYVLHLDQERQYGLGPAAHELSGAY